MLTALGAVVVLPFALHAMLAFRVTRRCPPPRSPRQASRRGARASLTVASYNVKGAAALWRPSHVGLLAHAIRALGADVVGLQEVHRRTAPSRFADQAVRLRDGTGMDMRFGASLHELGGAYGNALLSRLPVQSSEIVPLPSRGEPRSLLRCTVLAGDLEVDVFVTHLAAWGPLLRGLRRRQAECVALQLDRARPFVLLGDLNAPPGAGELAALAGLAPCGPPGEGTMRGGRRCLDHVLVGPGWRVTEARVVRAGPSDHWPVLARLEWHPGETPGAA